ncbi:class I mannose-6-phosphate isomerase [Neorhizobium galegae]|uniref:class I mannose-6-phosphate isomerase n=1 Tax=Neorhizobium galegae TaxID=399 RepID=UPI0006222C96|nr:class I mannose-6-phosphate isomerase [Neorhizobium galegae]CDZ60077.1 Mannose-6-phosphate isomerase, class I [Neorhizobium galegae bv. orientalis]KAB1121047.1 mannose-6-phosphate isomerase [Neorhizobium galegae]MCQ1808968.1 class I mannose-6-phosphate isomerase [Neorhizobium galegae]MCQ1838808.1 class I mannose-6-phosphate isomerase [Neorhizobium galegae]UIK08175.1 class I mannose-6-phosphate isomerase [Neorhizobium galegae]
MVIEQAGVRVARKPWGSHDLQPWTKTRHDDAIGEIWFERADAQAPDPALLLKLLFTKEALSIQVHPDDGLAQSLGMGNGKTEAWYILSAEPGAQVAVGLKRRLTQPELRHAILDGSVADIVDWRNAIAGDIIFVPAGTIHAIGAGLVVAEIQQRSDTTFRLFDYGRKRELHVEQAVAAADLEPAKAQAIPVDLTEVRTQLVSCPFFVLERVNLPADSNWELNAECETWVLVIAGEIDVGTAYAGIGDALFADASHTHIKAGSKGLTALFAYADAEPRPGLLRNLDVRATKPATRHLEQALIHHQQSAGLPFRSTEA